MKKTLCLIFFLFGFLGKTSAQDTLKTPVVSGLDNLLLNHLDKIQGQVLALVTNQTGVDHNSTPNYKRLMDLKGVTLKVIFSPEHGLFGEAAAGDTVTYRDTLASLPKVISLYGNTRKPTPEMLKGVTLILYDIQDVGARFYTYITTMGLVMEAAGALNIPVLVLDRPNPLGGVVVEGPLLKPQFRSFVGYYPIPIRYGLTVGELALMIVGEKWIEPQPKVEVMPLIGWKRDMLYDETGLPWVKPSPNITDLETALLYPGNCLLEGTNMSEGRGTRQPFKLIGSPWSTYDVGKELNSMKLPGIIFKPAKFTPRAIRGMAENPKFKNQVCLGMKAKVTDPRAFQSVRTGVQILYVTNAFEGGLFKIKPAWLNKLWGTPELVQLLSGRTNLKTVFAHLEKDEDAFRKQRKPYLLY
jgi:uncharacterized protein YbbC (DUF1343 family)